MYLHEQSAANGVWGTARLPAGRSLIPELLQLLLRDGGEESTVNLTGAVQGLEPALWKFS